MLRMYGIAEICSPGRTIFRSPQGATRSAPACGSSGCRTTRIRHRPRSGRPTFRICKRFCKEPSATSMCSQPHGLGMANAARCLVRRGHHPAAAESHAAKLGCATNSRRGWNEVAGRAANYVTDAHGVLLTDTRVGNSALTENNATRLFGPRIAIAWDPFRRW